MTRRTLAAVVLTGAALAVTGCATTPSTESATGPGPIAVVASTDVYGQIASEIGGGAVEVTSVIAGGQADPHSYEPSAQDQLTISRADLVIENGGGYDPFIDALRESSGSDAAVITAVEFAHDYPGADGDAHADATAAADAGTAAPDAAGEEHAEEEHAAGEEHAEEEHAEGEDHAEGEEHAHEHIEGFNEHVWYDPHTIEHVAEALVEELSALRPDDAEAFAANGAAFIEGIATLEGGLDDIAAAHAGDRVFVTEPVPLYLAAAAELENITPESFTEAVEEGQDVPPATLLEATRLLEGGDVAVLIANAQTGGAETTRVIDEAGAQGIPVVEFTETLPEGETYLSWMHRNIDALAGALQE